MNLIKPQVGVLTAIEKVHMEFFKSLEVVAKECSAVVRLLSPESTAVLNIDNRQVAMYRESLIARTLTVGRDSEADVRAESVVIMTKDECLGLKINISYQQSVFPIFLRGVVAQHQVYAVLTASAVGLALGMKMIDIGNALESYQPPKGRVIIIDGWRGSTLIDDTYNSSPAAALAALTTLSQIPIRKKGKRVAVLGDMLELGDYTESGHRLVGQQVVPAKVDLLVTVGKLSKAIAIGAREAGLAEAKLRSFTDQGEAIDFLKDIIVQNDVVLLKGSQSARIERVVKALMKNPDQAGDLLVRQSKRWLRK
jgi:UDP-N-acetylmuramyl pentapeptide synthase